jgi:hypothetical protein
VNTTTTEVVRTIPWINAESAKTVNVSEGDTYEFLDNVSTRAGHVHPKGSMLFVHDRTRSTPHDEIGPRGYNWICRTQFGISVWATLEHCIERGLLKKLESA